ncbi:MAG: phosphatase PAP2 family protein [Prolixibacteraceae bacterium]|nr:phosphatase PAP2 family protein [Prolixibacteraceae bacterium]
MVDILKQNRYFLLPFLVILIVSIALLVFRGNTVAFLFINKHHSLFADFWFLSFTKLGEGVITLLVIFILLWVSIREAFTLLVITLLVTIITALLKKIFFVEYDRPLIFLGEQMIRLVPGYYPPKLHTFPSGHTATAFSVYLYISFLVRHRGLKFGLFLVAFTVGYSRIYISAHFPADVIAGSLIAVVITILTYLFCRKLKASWIDRKIVFNPFKVLIRLTTQS